MKQLSIRDARQSLTHLEEILEKEGELLITRRGAVIARVAPATRRRAIPSHEDLRAQMPRLRPDSARLVRADRDAR